MFNRLLFTSLLLLLFSTLTQADEANLKSFFYTGQIKEQLELNTERYETKYKNVEYDDTCTREVPYQEEECGNVTKYKTVEYDGTCTRQIPYQDEECGYETKYKNECRTIPGKQVCHSEPHQVCHTETDQKCRTVSDGQRCHNENHQECRTVNGGRKCRNVTKQECRTVNNGQRCRNKQVCQRLPGGGKRCRNQRICEPVTKRVCRNVNKQVCTPTTKRECRNVSKRVCEPVTKRVCRPVRRQVCNTEYTQVCNWESSREVCTQVPYQDYVCHTVTKYNSETYSCKKTKQEPYQEHECKMVTKHKTESYACKKTKKVPYQDLVEKVEAKIDVNFDESIISDDFKSKIKFVSKLTGSNINLTANNTNEEKSLIYIEKQISKDKDGKEVHITGEYNVKLIPVKAVRDSLAKGISELEFNKTRVQFFIDKFDVPHNFSLKLNLQRKKKYFGTKTLLNRQLTRNEFEVIEHGETIEVLVDIDSLDLDIPKSKRKYYLILEFGVNLKNSSNLQNPRDLPSNKVLKHEVKKKM